MKLADIVGGAWGIKPDVFAEIQTTFARHMRGEKADLEAIEARIGKPLQNSKHDIRNVDGIAVISVDGVLAKRANLFTDISGGTSMQVLAGQIRSALEDTAVKGIVLHVDSPGGTVDGTQDVANAVRSARGKKPIVAVADGLMASAAYWIGSAADKIFIANDTTNVGSIGVVATHVDQSAREAQLGVKTTEITAGKYKRIASPFAPLSDEGHEHLQERVDYLYSIFVDAVAENRGVSAEAVLQRMADGRIFIGRQAIAAGLVDGIATLDEVVGRMAAGEFGIEDTQASTGDEYMDVVKLKQDFPAVYQAIIAEGATAERDRIKAVEAAALPGHDALIAGLKFDGKTSGGDAALAVNAAEKQRRASKVTQLREDADDVGAVRQSRARDDEDTTKPAADAPLTDRAKYAWDKDAKLRAEFSTFERYVAFFTADEQGLARVKRA